MKLSSTLFVIYNFDFVEKNKQIVVKMFNMSFLFVLIKDDDKGWYD